MPISPPETITVETTDIYCDGHTADAGHPRVYLTMTDQGSVDCPYCGRHFVLAANAPRTGTH